jgi:hypothetical protein
MKKVLASIVVAALAVTLTLASVIALVGATISISTIANPALRAAAVVAELLTGSFWLLGTTYVATLLATLIFAEKPQPQS